MPQQADKPTKAQIETYQVCQLLLYIQTKIPKMIYPNWVREAANNANPDVSKLTHATNMLLTVCKGMTEHEQARIMYNGRDPGARLLADWWKTNQ